MPTVLIVDDDPKLLKMLQRTLTYENLNVFTAPNGLEALPLVQANKPDLIIADLTMPGMDGFGLVEELKLDPRTRDIPVVVVSAKDITAEERRRLNGNIEAVYQKGSLQPRKFVDQLIHTIEDKNGA